MSREYIAAVRTGEIPAMVRRMWWRGLSPARIGDILEIDIGDVNALLFARLPPADQREAA